MVTQPGSPAAPGHVPTRGWRPDMPAWAGPVLVAPLVLMIGIFVITPLVILIAQSFSSGGESYVAFFESNAQRRALGITFRDSAVVTVLAVVIGGLVAWNLRVTRKRLVRAILLAAVVVPFLMGVVIKNYAMSLILQANGILSRMVEFLPFVDGPVNLMYTPTAVVIGILYSLLPFAIMVLVVTFNSIDTDLVLAAQVSGATRTGAVFGVALPLAAPGLLATAALIFMLSIGFYVTPVMLGGAQSPFLASLIHRQIFVIFDNGGAAASGTILILAAVLVLGALVLSVGIRRLQGAFR